MSLDSVRISAPCRIHFGLLSLADGNDVQYGGVGVMVDRPRVELEMQPSGVTRAHGPHSARVLEFIKTWREHTQILDHVRSDIRAAPPEHVGLGLGTQLGLAVATALDMLFDRPSVSVEERARSVRRGKRSAVGTYGFREGGLIVEGGKKPGTRLGQIHARIDLPRAWRVLLICPQGRTGLAGNAEKRAFGELPEVPASTRQALRNELFDILVPAARRSDFGAFSDSVFRYGTMAGELFTACQGGPFASSETARWVKWIRDSGVLGVGQSSWGPTIYCWFPDAGSAARFAVRFQAAFVNLDAKLLVTSVARLGVRVETN